jgi:hypothetical protein
MRLAHDLRCVETACESMNGGIENGARLGEKKSRHKI